MYVAGLEWKRVLPRVCLGMVVCMSFMGLALTQSFTVCEALRNEPEDWVVAGTGGWLFAKEDTTLPIKLGESKVYLERLSQALRGQGITLVAVVNPRRGTVASQYFESSEAMTSGFDVAEATSRYQLFLEDLRDVGILAPDLSAVVSSEEGYFYKRDHHWTPEGARAAARAVAGILESNPAYAELQKTQFITSSDGSTVPFEGGWSRRVKRTCQTTIPDEALTVYETNGQTSVGLLDDVPEPEVVLVGTSYSKPARNPGYNFEGFLKEALSLDVLNEAVTAGGPFTALQTYFLSENYQQNKPAFIVWEMQMPVSRVFKNKTVYRQLIPAVYGACQLEESVVEQSTKVSGTSEVILGSDLENVQGSDYFLYLEFSDPTLVEFGLTLKHRDGQEDKVEIERSTRVENSGKFFLELSNDIASPLQEVILRLGEGVTTTVNARVCNINPT